MEEDFFYIQIMEYEVILKSFVDEKEGLQEEILNFQMKFVWLQVDYDRVI